MSELASGDAYEDIASGVVGRQLDVTRELERWRSVKPGRSFVDHAERTLLAREDEIKQSGLVGRGAALSPALLGLQESLKETIASVKANMEREGRDKATEYEERLVASRYYYFIEEREQWLEHKQGI